MRYVVRAERREPITYSTAGEAVSKAWSLMGSGATGLYIYDNVTCEAFLPGEFARLFKNRVVRDEVRDQR